MNNRRELANANFLWEKKGRMRWEVDGACVCGLVAVFCVERLCVETESGGWWRGMKWMDDSDEE